MALNMTLKPPTSLTSPEKVRVRYKAEKGDLRIIVNQAANLQNYAQLFCQFRTNDVGDDSNVML